METRISTSSPPTIAVSGLFLDGKWTQGEPIPVTNKYSGQSIGTVHVPNSSQLNLAFDSAKRGAEIMSAMPTHRRCAILLLGNTRPEMKVMANEIFGPVASIIASPDFDEALRQANSTDYGLQAAIFTRDIDRVLHAIRKLNFGGVIVNDMPAFRVDHMPYGGVKQSGLGREGLRFAIEEMTEIQMVAIRKNKLGEV